MRNLCKVYTSSDLSAWKVLNPLWLAVGPIKLQEADVIRLVQAGWGGRAGPPLCRHLQQDRTSPLAVHSPTLRCRRPAAWCERSSMATWSTATAQESPARPPAAMMPAPRNICLS
jgi:hypothetical protein